MSKRPTPRLLTNIIIKPFCEVSHGISGHSILQASHPEKPACRSRPILRNVDATWDDATAPRGKPDTRQSNTVRRGQAMCVVGFTTARYFIRRNGWATDSDDQGFAYAGFCDERYGMAV